MLPYFRIVHNVAKLRILCSNLSFVFLYLFSKKVQFLTLKPKSLTINEFVTEKWKRPTIKKTVLSTFLLWVKFTLNGSWTTLNTITNFVPYCCFINWILLVKDFTFNLYLFVFLQAHNVLLPVLDWRMEPTNLAKDATCMPNVSMESSMSFSANPV